MSTIKNKTKILIGVPAETFSILKKDAGLFEICKPLQTENKGYPEINMNGLLSRVLVAYYAMYRQEKLADMRQIIALAEPLLSDRKKAEAFAKKFMKEINRPAEQRRNGKHSERLTLKPTRDTDWIISDIQDNIIAGSDVSCSRYLSRLFISYSGKPLYERERITFRDTAEFLLKACREKKEIRFTTNRNPGLIHRVIPYALVVHGEEMNNYLLCQEYNRNTGRNEAGTYRLCRINNPGYTDDSGSLDPDVIPFLEQMKKQGPQWAVKGKGEICVRLSPAGQASYQQIYIGRPAVERIEVLPGKTDKKDALYYFSASEEQVFRFVIRFNAGEAVVVSPSSLRERIRNHYRTAAACYER